MRNSLLACLASMLDALMPKLLYKQVVFVGETHDEYAHHLAQLEIIRRLHGAHPDLVIAMEQFRQPSQPDLDDYVADRIDEKTLLQRTRFYQTSIFDYRLFRPVLRYARDEHIPIVALNIPDEISHKVAQGGFAALAGDERKWIPAEIDRENLRYRQRVNEVYHLHPQGIFHGFAFCVAAGHTRRSASWKSRSRCVNVNVAKRLDRPPSGGGGVMPSRCWPC